MKTKILLIRHGQSSANNKHVVAGRMDMPLSKIGKRQGRLVARALKKIKIDAIYSSPLPRAEATAMYTAKQKKLPLHVHEGLLELDFGVCDGKPIAELIAQKNEEIMIYFRHCTKASFTGGESTLQAAERMFEAIKEIARGNEGKTVAIFTHGVAIGLLWMYLTAGFENNPQRRIAPNASITELSYEDGELKAVEFGRVEHLNGLITSATIQKVNTDEE